MHRLSNGILRFNRAQGSKGQSCIFACSPDDYSATQQTILEKTGVSISIVHGVLPPATIKQMRADHTSILCRGHQPRRAST